MIQNGHSIKYENKEYHLQNEQERVLLRPKTRVMVIETLDVYGNIEIQKIATQKYIA